MLEFYPSKLFRTYPTKINAHFNLQHEFGKETLSMLESELKSKMTDRYAKWMVTEYAAAYWLMSAFGFPDVEPNKDEYLTDLNYEDQRYCNFHVKAIEMHESTISGLVSLERPTPEPLLSDAKVITHDVIMFMSYDFSEKDVCIHGTIPARLALPLWKDPFMRSLVGKKKVINFDDVLALDNVIDLKSTPKFMSKPEVSRMTVTNILKRGKNA